MAQLQFQRRPPTAASTVCAAFLARRGCLEGFPAGTVDAGAVFESGVRPAAPMALPLVEEVLPAAATTPEDDATAAPGWFESSWELQRGLEVREGLPFELLTQGGMLLAH